ncbi:hypothetical protein [Haemophilus sp. Marseille-Q0026]|uniref:hypothetical protein n=1 Tax=Haemophilus sp. Marseille-Q0026 TaxID=2866580 RepID=UPI001CF87FB9|nr:hypothetical protein [Haemophilus sp. Marseille-Q0026]
MGFHALTNSHPAFGQAVCFLFKLLKSKLFKTAFIFRLLQRLAVVADVSALMAKGLALR